MNGTDSDRVSPLTSMLVTFVLVVICWAMVIAVILWI